MAHNQYGRDVARYLEQTSRIVEQTGYSIEQSGYCVSFGYACTMPHSTQPFIHLYVWPERFLYLGPSTTTSLHRNHAATWLVAQTGSLRVTLGDGTVLENEVVYIPPETEFRTTQAESLIAALYWEPESASFRRATAQFATAKARAFPCRYTGSAKLVELYAPEATRQDADQLIANLFGLDDLGGAQDAIQDARIATAIAFLRESPHAYDSIHTLAARVHLSASRFAHLFKQEVGVPVRRYVLWQKMRRALDLAMAGESLTSAALTAGFADSAHLSRTVRSIQGVAPEFLFRHRERLVVHK
ncbi:MAG: AraC family transcriptional regulator [Betaproteobacteria bacterium]|jgi:AraC family transcriptional regulator|nr:AraC family transcriptional regulator [Betaproteobacteria bacterium]